MDRVLYQEFNGLCRVVFTAIVYDENFIRETTLIQVGHYAMHEGREAASLIVGWNDNRKRGLLSRARCHVGTASCRSVLRLIRLPLTNGTNGI